jgi:putative ubiquitin-RnfH superfamily antitoxin RatB of RatAB toxin-antitoxin module
MKRCLVAYATPAREYLWPLELPDTACIADALAAARALAPTEPIPWDCARVGVFGELRERSAACAEGDRIELYRPLRGDPRARRRERMRGARR